jgi:glycerol-3-phosphate cytidylyltransferase
LASLKVRSMNRIGFACGVFDIFHIGHAIMLEECRQKCDYLVIAVNRAEQYDGSINPGKKKPIFSIEDRVKVLESCRFVDEVVTYNGETELIELMNSGRFQIRFLGDDYKGKPITESSYPMEIIYVDRSHGWSSSKIKNLIG